MPVYEYRCQKCSRKAAIFFRSISAAEKAGKEVACPRCGSSELQRLFSRFAMGRSAASEGEEIYDFDRMTAGLDADDPQSVARWARKLGQQSGLGEELGAGFDEALDRIEGGEDPEAVMSEIDPAFAPPDDGDF